MPFVRGRVIPEVESVGRAKTLLDVLLWLKNADAPGTLKIFDELEHLRIYLGSFEPAVASIRLLIPLDDKKTDAVMTANSIQHTFVSKQNGLDNYHLSCTNEVCL